MSGDVDYLKEFESSSSKIRIYKKDKKKIFKEYKEKDIIDKEYKKQIEISDALSSFKKIKSPRPKKFKEGLEYTYFEGIVFEKFYIKNLKFFSPSKKILNALDLLAQGLCKIHSVPINKDEFKNKSNIKVKRKNISLVHGDLNSENIICKKKGDEICIIDSPKLRLHSFYHDLGKFIHFLNFKIPLKFFSLKAYFYGNYYKNYFLKSYSYHSGNKLDLKRLNKFKLHFARSQKSLLKKNYSHHIKLQRLLLKLFRPFLLFLVEIRIKKLERREKK